MDGTWLDGWIGALLAAAITVGATVGWDAHVRRRAMLDDVLAGMAAAADELAVAVLTKDAAESSGHLRPLVTLSLRASALAGRPVGLLPARFVAPIRWRMARQIDTVMRGIGESSGKVNDENADGRAALAASCGQLSLVALLWWRRPLAFLRREPLSVLDELADEFERGLVDIGSPPS